MNKAKYSFNIFIFISLLSSFVYTGFFLEKGRFYNQTRTEIEQVAIDYVATKAKLSALRESVQRLEKTHIPSDPVLKDELTKELLEQTRLRDEYELKYSTQDEYLSSLESREKLLNSQGHYDNIFYVIRALSLGAIGAMLTLISSESHKIKLDKGGTIFSHDAYWQLIISNILSGAIISVVAFSIFYTNQLSLFSIEFGSENEEPNFWRATLVCLIAGAFSEKIYDMISGKISSLDKERAHNNKNQTDA